jgi:hypothetical protein
MRYVKRDAAPDQRFYDGKPCKRCMGTLRYVRGGVCVACQKARYRERTKTTGVTRLSERPPAEVLSDRDGVFSVVPTLEQRLFGDPLPGRSALDQKRASV